MKKLVMAAVAAAALASAGAASAATVFDFQLNGNLSNAVTNAVSLTNNGGTLSASGIDFAANKGPSVTGLGNLNDYTLQMGFRIDYNGGYVKLVDFFNRTADTGLYNWNGHLYFYGAGSANGLGPAGAIGTSQVTLSLTRTAGVVKGSINDVQQFSFVDTNGLGVINNTLHFLQDDFPTGGEASGGFVDYIRLADAGGFTASSTTPGAVPEPATWAMMLLGFFGLGGVLRANKRAGARLGSLRVA